MYTHAKFGVKKDHTITDPSILGKGVRWVKPLLFKIFINDIDSIFSFDTCFPVQLIDTKLNCLLYADDQLREQRRSPILLRLPQGLLWQMEVESKFKQNKNHDF
jgi:hypothetical protein